jgi:hypothetical protein
MFVIVRIMFLGKEKLEKLPGKLENSEKTESAFFYGIFVELKAITRYSNDGNAFLFLFCSLRP